MSHPLESILPQAKTDEPFAEWVKGLLAVPFVLYSQPNGVFGDGPSVAKMAEEAHRRYAEIMRDVEVMIDDHSKYRTRQRSRCGDRI